MYSCDTTSEVIIIKTSAVNTTKISVYQALSVNEWVLKILFKKIQVKKSAIAVRSFQLVSESALLAKYLYT